MKNLFLKTKSSMEVTTNSSIRSTLRRKNLQITIRHMKRMWRKNGTGTQIMNTQGKPENRCYTSQPKYIDKIFLIINSLW